MNVEYIKLAACALISAIAGSQTVHMIYQPMEVSLFLESLHFLKIQLYIIYAFFLCFKKDFPECVKREEERRRRIRETARTTQTASKTTEKT
jgi:hypothetical protein